MKNLSVALLIFTVFWVTNGGAVASVEKDSLIALRAHWIEHYEGMITGQGTAIKEWKPSKESVDALQEVHDATKKLNLQFNAYSSESSSKTRPSLLSGIGQFCSAVNRLESVRGPSPDTTYIMNLFSTEWMLEYFADQREESAVAQMCRGQKAYNSLLNPDTRQELAASRQMSRAG